jgi:hypothetical protein
MKAFKYNNKNNFIAGWYISDKVCDDMIKFFKKSKDVIDGTCNRYGKTGIYKDIKDSRDLSLPSNSQDTIPINYLIALKNVLEKYKEKYSFSNLMHGNWSIVENFNIQKYPKKGAFKKFHFERTGIDGSSLRHLVFMTYLNDVKVDGETEFFHQKLKVKPEKGLTLIWPADWTFTHRGLPAPKEIKYIATGWYSYVK